MEPFHFDPAPASQDSGCGSSSSSSSVVNKLCNIALPILMMLVFFPERECFHSALHLKGQSNLLYDCSTFCFLSLNAGQSWSCHWSWSRSRPFFSRLRLQPIRAAPAPQHSVPQRSFIITHFYYREKRANMLSSCW